MPVTQEINDYRSNVTFNKWHGQNNMDNRGVTNRSDRTGIERVKGQRNANKETTEPEKKIRTIPRGARPKAHGRHNTATNERCSFPVEEVMIDDERQDNKNKGADMMRALQLSKKPNEMQRAKLNFKRRYLAFNTMQARNSKRRKVMEIMVNLAESDNPFPVDQGDVGGNRNGVR